jgi:transcriptional regulator with XRE-family HTH domain
MNRAKQIRIERNLGVVDVVKGAQISHRSLKKVENGDDVHPAVLARLSTFYGVKASELLAPAHFETPRGEAA